MARLASTWVRLALQSRPYSLVIAGAAEYLGDQSGKMLGPANFFGKFSARDSGGEGTSSLQVLPVVAAAEIDALLGGRNGTWAWQQEGGRDPLKKGHLFLTVTPRRPLRSRGSAIAARP
jgi:hypothetical protein